MPCLPEDEGGDDEGERDEKRGAGMAGMRRMCAGEKEGECGNEENEEDEKRWRDGVWGALRHSQGLAVC